MRNVSKLFFFCKNSFLQIEEGEREFFSSPWASGSHETREHLGVVKFSLSVIV